MAKGRSDKGIVVFFIGVLTILVGYVAYNLSINNFSWAERLSHNLEQPFDLKIFHQLLKSSTSEGFEYINSPLTSSLKDQTGTNYVFTGQHLVLDSTNSEALIDFVKRGNNAFIISSAPSPQLFGVLYTEGILINSYRAQHADSIDVSLGQQNDSKKYRFIYRGDKGVQSRLWSYTRNYTENQKKEEIGFFEVPGTKDEFCNFFTVKLGKGQIFFHTEPILLSNYYIIEDFGFSYASELIRHLPDQPVLWDEYHQIYHYTPDDQTYAQSPLKYIFSQTALRYAWFVLLGGVLLFIIFKSKREQQIIPILPKLPNTSIEFAKSLGVLYFQADSPKYLAKEMMKLFDDFNRKRYRINPKPLDPEFKPMLAQKARVELELIERIYILERQAVYNPSAGMNKITPLYQALQEYYQKAKK